MYAASETPATAKRATTRIDLWGCCRTWLQVVRPRGLALIVLLQYVFALSASEPV